MRRPQRLALVTELAQIAPGEDAGVMAVVEGEAHGVVADRIDSGDRYVALAADGLALLGTVPLNLGRGAEDAQQLGRDIVGDAVVEDDAQRAPIAPQADFAGPGSFDIAHGPALMPLAHTRQPPADCRGGQRRHERADAEGHTA